MSYKNKFNSILPAAENFLTSNSFNKILNSDKSIDRRNFFQKSFLGLGLTIASAKSNSSDVKDDPLIVNHQKQTISLGNPVGTNPYGFPSKHEGYLIRRESPGLSKKRESSIAFTPLQGLFGIITPNSLHFERHHSGWYDIDPNSHRLMINGLVSEPKIFTLGDLMRLPSVSKIHFIECGANTAMEWGGPTLPTVQYTHGMLSCCEFTGVPLSLLLEFCDYNKSKAKYLLAEGSDASSLTRTIPIDRALDDVIVAWGMNGEMLRPENGYPLRLVVPGAQGVSWVKWLRRIEVGEFPYATREESTQYVDLMPDGKLRQYSYIQECKSVITSPSGGQRLLGKGFYNITGLAWSGRGIIKRGDVSIDGGKNWNKARLENPILPKCLTRFNFDWDWDGSSAILQSRALDDSGYVQPKISELRAVRGSKSVYHNNAIQSWRVESAGEVLNVQIS